MRQTFGQYVNQPNRKDPTALMKTKLIARFVGTDTAPGIWHGLVSKSTLERYMSDKKIFKYRLVTKAPSLKPVHIAKRKAFAEEVMKKSAAELMEWAHRCIFLDGTIFGDKFEEGFARHKVRYLADAKNPIIHFVSQLPQVETNIQLYMAIGYGVISEPYIINDHHPEESNRINSDLFAEFLKTVVAPIAVEMRTRQNLPPDAPMYLIMDYASVHRAKVLRPLMKELHLVDGKLPPKCPEVNVIEMLWSWIKDQMKLKPKDAGRSLRDVVVELCKEVQAGWQAKVDHLVESVIERTRQLHDAEGGKFRYRGSKERKQQK